MGTSTIGAPYGVACCSFNRTIFSKHVSRLELVGRMSDGSQSKENSMMMSTVIGGAMLPHAPQFFTMPETEEKKNVEHVRAVAAEIGDRLRALKPDLWIIFSNDHAEQFFHQ